MSIAFWSAIYTEGHDTARLQQTGDGWKLTGTAVYLADGVPVWLRYGLDLAGDWSTTAGWIDGEVGGTAVAHEFRRERSGWVMNGQRQHAVEGAVDLDFGFTPATNLPQLRRMDLEVGGSREIVVAWFDITCAALQPLPQVYQRTSEQAYAYKSPQGPYEAVLSIADNGFVSDYPGLWRLKHFTS